MSRKRRWSGSTLGMAGVAGAVVVCCAGTLLVATLGIGVITAALTSWWVLVPVVLAAAGIVAWYAWRRSCRIRAGQAADSPGSGIRAGTTHR